MADNYLRILSLDHAINDARYKKWIPLLSYRLGRGSGPSATGSRAFRNIEVTKNVDRVTQALMELCTKGRSAGEAALFTSGLSAGSSQAILLMKSVYVDSVHYGGSSGAGGLVEVVQLNFSDYQYMPLAHYLALRGGPVALVGMSSWFN